MFEQGKIVTVSEHQVQEELCSKFEVSPVELPIKFWKRPLQLRGWAFYEEDFQKIWSCQDFQHSTSFDLFVV